MIHLRANKFARMPAPEPTNTLFYRNTARDNVIKLAIDPTTSEKTEIVCTKNRFGIRKLE
jgi:hypothetical protein